MLRQTSGDSMAMKLNSDMRVQEHPAMASGGAPRLQHMKSAMTTPNNALKGMRHSMGTTGMVNRRNTAISQSMRSEILSSQKTNTDVSELVMPGEQSWDRRKAIAKLTQMGTDARNLVNKVDGLLMTSDLVNLSDVANVIITHFRDKNKALNRLTTGD